MKNLRFRKTTKRNDFTKIFGNIGARRLVWIAVVKYRRQRKHRTKMQMERRAHQGWKNKVFSKLNALKIRLRYGRRTPIRKFIK